MSDILLAVIIGLAFGAVLDAVGATNPNYIIKMLNFKNLHLMKAILLGIGVASILLFAGQKLGVVDVGHMSVKTAYVGVYVGGILLGLGWAITGFCPGTGLGAAAAGRIDAMFFVLGGLVGAGAYMLSYNVIKTSGLLEKVFGGKTTLGAIPGSKFTALFSSLPGDIIGIGLGVVFIVVAILLPSKSVKA